jgi:hypothetical protein
MWTLLINPGPKYNPFYVESAPGRGNHQRPTGLMKAVKRLDQTVFNPHFLQQRIKLFFIDTQSRENLRQRSKVARETLFIAFPRCCCFGGQMGESHPEKIAFRHGAVEVAYQYFAPILHLDSGLYSYANKRPTCC